LFLLQHFQLFIPLRWFPIFSFGGFRIDCLAPVAVRTAVIQIAFFAVRYALEALYVGEVNEYKDLVALQVAVVVAFRRLWSHWIIEFVIQHVDLATHVHSTFGYDLGNYGRNVGVVFLIGFLIRVLGVAVMAIIDRDKKV
jgi:hypothetical protein